MAQLQRGTMKTPSSSQRASSVGTAGDTNVSKHAELKIPQRKVHVGTAPSSGEDSMKAMWSSMQHRLRARRSHSEPATQRSQESHSLGSLSTESSGLSSGASTPRSNCSSWCSEASDTSQKSSYSLPRGCRVKNTFLDFDENFGNDTRDRTLHDSTSAPLCSSAQDSAEPAIAEVAPSQCSASQTAAESDAGAREAPSALIEKDPPTAGGGAPMRARATGGRPPKPRPVAKSTSRPRPPKPKRLLGKALAERVLSARWGGDEVEFRAAQQALKWETRSDPLLHSYTMSVLRSLNSEASARFANGEDPLLTAARR